MPIISPKEISSATSTVSPVTSAQRLAAAAQPAAVPAAAVVEPAEALTEKPDPKEELLSPRFAALARQQKEIRRQQAELRAEKEKMSAEIARYQSDYIPKAKLTEDPLGTLSSNGISYDQLVELAVQYPTSNDPVIKQIRDELTAIKEEKTQRQKLDEETQAKNYETAVNQIRNEAKLLIDSDAAFETVKEEGQQDAVVALIEETFKDEGRLLSVEEAAQMVEEFLIEDAMRKANLKKVKARLQPPAPAPLPEVNGTKQSPKPPTIKTITNAALSAPSKPLTAADRRARAIAIFRGEQI